MFLVLGPMETRLRKSFAAASKALQDANSAEGMARATARTSMHQACLDKAKELDAVFQARYKELQDEKEAATAALLAAFSSLSEDLPSSPP